MGLNLYVDIKLQCALVPSFAQVLNKSVLLNVQSGCQMKLSVSTLISSL
jgi:hypothetical protein